MCFNLADFNANFQKQFQEFISIFDDKTELDFLNHVFVSTRADNPFRKSGFLPYKLVWLVTHFSKTSLLIT